MMYEVYNAALINETNACSTIADPSTISERRTLTIKVTTIALTGNEAEVSYSPPVSAFRV